MAVKQQAEPMAPVVTLEQQLRDVLEKMGSKLSRGMRHSAAVLLACRAREHVRLTLDLARQMRSRYRETGNAALVAREFGVHPSHAHRVVTHQAWREPSPWAI